MHSLAINHGMQACLRRRLARTTDCRPVHVDFEQVAWRERAFIQTRRRDEDATSRAHAEISARRRHPPTRVTPACRRAELLNLLVQRRRIGDHTCMQCSNPGG